MYFERMDVGERREFVGCNRPFRHYGFMKVITKLLSLLFFFCVLRLSAMCIVLLLFTNFLLHIRLLHNIYCIRKHE